MTQYLILRDLAVIFAVSLLVILLFHRLKLPALPGFIVAGVLLGPNALGLVSDVHQVESLAEVGVILLLFTIGIEFSLGRLREMGRQVVVGGLSQVGLTVAASALVARASGTSWQIALLLGFLVALSSTALVLKGLTDKGEIDAPHGRLATGVLIFQDLCVVPMMLVLPFLAGRAAGGPSGLLLALGKAVLVVIGVLVVARTVVPRALAEILKTRSRELFLIAIILLGTLTALGTAAAGASLALGAFLAGLVISESDYGHQAMAELLPFRDVFISLFFVAVGMLVQVQFVRDHPLLALGGVGVIMGGKTITAAVGPALLGYSGRVALLAGLAVSQIGEFSFVLAREGRAAGLLAEGPYQTFLAVAVFTMLLTPFLLEAGPALVDRIERVVPLDRLLPGFRPRAIAAGEQPLTDHVIIAGYGLNGRNLAAALRTIRAPYLIVELNSQTVQQARGRGEPAFYGDATREEILHALGVERARMLVAAISDRRHPPHGARGARPESAHPHHRPHALRRGDPRADAARRGRRHPRGVRDVGRDLRARAGPLQRRAPGHRAPGGADPRLPLPGAARRRRRRRRRRPEPRTGRRHSPNGGGASTAGPRLDPRWQEPGRNRAPHPDGRAGAFRDAGVGRHPHARPSVSTCGGRRLGRGGPTSPAQGRPAARRGGGHPFRPRTDAEKLGKLGIIWRVRTHLCA